MKSLFKKILQYYLKCLAKLAIFIYRPRIIAISGSINKTFFKEEIARILQEKGKHVRSNLKSFNTEIGLPLAILNLPSGYNSYRRWWPVILAAPRALLKDRFWKRGERFLVLELGVSNRGDMKYLLSIIKPEIAIITEITQRYLESFGDMDTLAGEYEYLVEKIGKEGLVLLNYDNSRIRPMAEKAKGKVKFFGFSPLAEMRAVKAERTEKGERVEVKDKDGEKQAVYQLNRFGHHHVHALLARLLLEKCLRV